MKFFENIKTIEEIKKIYHSLSLQYHPDNGGDIEIMKTINAEYKEAFTKINASINKNISFDEVPENFINIINELIKMVNLEIELCGSWIWISGNTYSNRQNLKNIGCKYAPKKKMWYWHTPESTSRNRQAKSMESIRATYGSQKIENTNSINSKILIG